MGEILECFFILFEIGVATSGRPKVEKNEEEHNNIASLGKLALLQNRSSELTRDEEVVLGTFNLSKLWR